MLVGVKCFADERYEETPVHLLLTLTPRTRQQNIPTTLSAEWIDLANKADPIKKFVRENFGDPKLRHIRDALQTELEDKIERIKISFSTRKGELLKQRANLKTAIARGVPAAQTKAIAIKTASV